jgi:hypothetical protein
MRAAGILSLTAVATWLLTVATPAFGQLIIQGNTADAETTQSADSATGTPSGTLGASNQTKVGTLLAGTFRSGGTAATFIAISPVFVFQLPVLAAGESIIAADLRLNAGKSLTPTYNGDLYGLGFRTSATVLNTDYFNGSLDTTDATLLQDNYVNPTVGTAAARNTDAVGDVALLNYLNAQYAAGAVGGNFVFLRVSPDFDTFPVNPTGGASIGYPMTAADSATTATVPQLTLTIIPEPTVAVMLIGGLGLLGGRRRPF